MLKATTKKSEYMGIDTYKGVVECYTDQGVLLWHESTNVDMEVERDALHSAESLLRFHVSMNEYKGKA